MKQVPAIAKAVLFDERLQICPRLVLHDAGAARRFPLSQAFGFEQRHIDAGRCEDISHDAADGTPAYHGDLGMKLAAVLRIRGPAGGREPVEPVADPVVDFGHAGTIL